MRTRDPWVRNGGDLAGSSVGGVCVQRLVASGGSSDVYLAVAAVDPARQLALKVAVTISADDQRRFAREAEHLQAIRHPGVARVHGHGCLPDGRAFLLADFVDGVPLDEHAAGATTASMLAAMTSVAEALQCVHAAGIAHGDLKPGNVLVDAHGRPVLVDFGAARAARLQVTTTGPALLTPYYASPETLGGGPATERSDVYAFGVVLRDLLHDAVDRDTLPPAMQRDGTRLVQRCMAADPRRRYAHAGELRRDLECLRARGRLPRTFGWRRWWRHHRRVVGVAAAATAVLGSLAAMTVEGSQRADVARAEALTVSEFLVRLLDQAAPGAAGPAVTLTAAWQRAEPLIATTFRGHPHAEARVRMAYGRAHAGLQEWRRAAAHLERAIDLLAIDPGDHPETLVWCQEVLAQCRGR